MQEDCSTTHLWCLLEQLVTAARRVQQNVPGVDDFDPVLDSLLRLYEDILEYRKA